MMTVAQAITGALAGWTGKAAAGTHPNCGAVR